jgi:hypothetical protein
MKHLQIYTILLFLIGALMSKVIYEKGSITFEECYNRSDGSIRECSKVFSPDNIYFKNE